MKNENILSGLVEPKLFEDGEQTLAQYTLWIVWGAVGCQPKVKISNLNKNSNLLLFFLVIKSKAITHFIKKKKEKKFPLKHAQNLNKSLGELISIYTSLLENSIICYYIFQHVIKGQTKKLKVRQRYVWELMRIFR